MEPKLEDFKSRLEAFPWDTVRHAYGPASDTPAYLLALLEEQEHSEAWCGLYGNLYHQGTRYNATLAAIPFLVEMLGLLPDMENRIRMVYYLMDVALGGSDSHLATGYRPARAQGAYMPDGFGAELHDKVENLLFPTMLEWAQGRSEIRERGIALWSLAWFPRRWAESTPVLEAAKVEETALISNVATFALEIIQLGREEEREDADEDESELDARAETQGDLLNELLEGEEAES